MKGWFLILLSILVPSISFAAVGRVTYAKGKVDIVKKGRFKGVSWKTLNGEVDVGDIVRTKRKSEAQIKFIDNTEVFLAERTRLIVEKYIPEREANMSLPFGRVIYRVSGRTAGAFNVKTPIALIGVKGTEFLVDVNFERVLVAVLKGVVEVKNFFTGERVILGSGSIVRIEGKEKTTPEHVGVDNVKNIVESSTMDGKKVETYTVVDYPVVSADVAEDVIQSIEVKEKEDNLNVQVEIPETSIEGM
ncbi:FecR family protein [Desulfurobacterium atlanticum]|uniref:FecR family protein n=1 Tax=Desulfurobacterium atlanticum TaxID=240169 RepID=A0A238YNS9_9BACT|nr:FecR family protein [Desulfurobacterium atlanticum]SNR72314.1 FecR family protein [Desulfurobacterium atlanticum]